MALLLRGLLASQEPSDANSSEHSHRGGEEAATPRSVPPEILLNYLEGDSVKTLLRSLYVLDEWLEKNEGYTEDEVRLRRVKHWREEALEQLRLELNISRV
jgi:hypothetical protein